MKEVLYQLIYAILGSMGSGKTLSSVILADMLQKKEKNLKIYSNFHIKLPNAIYTPLLLIPFSELKNAVIIADDIYALANLKALIGIIVNLSRKRSLHIILTAQYYTFIPKQIRTLTDFFIFPEFNEGRLFWSVLQNTQITRIEIRGFQKYFNLYNTEEIVPFYTDERIKQEIIKNSNTIEDLDTNLQIAISNSRKRASIRKQILSEYADKYIKSVS